MNLNGCKATRNRDIFVNIWKSTVDIRFPYITKTIHLSIEEGSFPDKLKLTGVNQFSKKECIMCQRSLKELCINH